MLERKAMGNDILELLESQSEALRAHGVKRIGIFGSYARDEADVKSDVDVYVELNEAQRTFRNFNAIYEILEAALQRQIDLVTDQALSERKAKIILPTVRYASLGH